MMLFIIIMYMILILISLLNSITPNYFLVYQDKSWLKKVDAVTFKLISTRQRVFNSIKLEFIMHFVILTFYVIWRAIASDGLSDTFYDRWNTIHDCSVSNQSSIDMEVAIEFRTFHRLFIYFMWV